MIKTYTIYNTITKTITSRVTCQEELINLHLDASDGYIEGEADRYEYKVNDAGDGFIELTDTEKKEILYIDRKDTIPPIIDVSLSDENLSMLLDEYFLGQANISQWRIDNYAILREKAYPEISEKVDAEVKIHSGIEALVTEGEAQLTKYIEDCLNVKTRFPKE